MPTTVEGSPSTRSMNAPPRLSTVNAPATSRGSPVSTYAAISASSTSAAKVTEASATARWRDMRGHTGVLHSGHSVFRLAPGAEPREAHAVAEASVSFAAEVDDDEIAAYVASGEPLHVAGAFTVDSLGGAFIERVDGDPSTVVGMSLSTVRRLIRELGGSWTDLWNRS